MVSDVGLRIRIFAPLSSGDSAFLPARQNRAQQVVQPFALVGAAARR